MTSVQFFPFRGLPLTPEDDAKIRTYIQRCEADGEPWNTLALDYMIADMLYPPPTEDRIEFCEQYVLELEKRMHQSEQQTAEIMLKNLENAPATLSSSEWKWVVREAYWQLKEKRK